MRRISGRVVGPYTAAVGKAFFDARSTRSIANTTDVPSARWTRTSSPAASCPMSAKPPFLPA